MIVASKAWVEETWDWALIHASTLGPIPEPPRRHFSPRLLQDEKKVRRDVCLAKVVVALHSGLTVMTDIWAGVASDK